MTTQKTYYRPLIKVSTEFHVFDEHAKDEIDAGRYLPYPLKEYVHKDTIFNKVTGVEGYTSGHFRCGTKWDIYELAQLYQHMTIEQDAEQYDKFSSVYTISVVLKDGCDQTVGTADIYLELEIDMYLKYDWRKYATDKQLNTWKTLQDANAMNDMLRTEDYPVDTNESLEKYMEYFDDNRYYLKHHFTTFTAAFGSGELF
jgi:predicted adenine nucleotide alpha hydrolase (AANH) superfamily ATPase